MNQKEFIQALALHEIHLSQEQVNQFDQYYHLLVEWNQKMNLTAITEEEEVYLKHFYDSLSLAFYVDITKESLKLMDVGAGAGFPSIPLKIVFPHLEVTIVDSLKKRIHFLETVKENLGLQHVQVFHGRAEDFGQDVNHRECYDFVTARAVARLEVLAEYCLPFAKVGGQFVAMKAAKADEEIQSAKPAIATLGGKFAEDIAFELPEEVGERHLLCIQKRKVTPKKYPRKAGLPQKKPIQSF